MPGDEPIFDSPLFGHETHVPPDAYDQEFYVTDSEAAEDGRAVCAVVAEELQGFASASGHSGAPDEEATSMAVQNLVLNAQYGLVLFHFLAGFMTDTLCFFSTRSMGANGVLNLETDFVLNEAGETVDVTARGTAVLLG